MPVDDPRARDMLRAYRGEHTLAGSRGAGIRDRLERSLDAGVAALPEESREPWYLRRRWIAALALAAGVLLALALAPTIATQLEAPVRSQAVRTGDAPAPQGAEIRDTLPGADEWPAPAIAPAPQHVAPIDPAPAREEPAKPSRTRARATAEADDLVVELGLVRRARRALQDGDAEAALAILDAHAQAFPRGQMLEDRLALRVEALCAAGADRQARAEAKVLRKRFPGSAHPFDEAQPCAAK